MSQSAETYQHTLQERQALGQWFFAKETPLNQWLKAQGLRAVAAPTEHHDIRLFSRYEPDTALPINAIKILWSDNTDDSSIEPPILFIEDDILVMAPSLLNQIAHFEISVDEVAEMVRAQLQSVSVKEISPSTDTHRDETAQVLTELLQEQSKVVADLGYRLKWDEGSLRCLRDTLDVDLTFWEDRFSLNGDPHITALELIDVVRYTQGESADFNSDEDYPAPISSPVMGIYIPHQDEPLSTSISKAQLIESQLLAHFAPEISLIYHNLSITPSIAIATPYQLARWAERSSLIVEPAPYIPEAVPISEVLSYLRRALAEQGLGDEYELRVKPVGTIDVEITLHDRTGKPAYFSVMGLKSASYRDRRGRQHYSETETIEHVTGFKCFPDDFEDTQRIAEMKRVTKMWRAQQPLEDFKGRKVVMLSVTPELMYEWQKYIAIGQAFQVFRPDAELDPEEGMVDLDRIPPWQEFSNHSAVQSVTYVTHEIHEPGIGAKPSYIKIKLQDGTDLRVFLDVGADFSSERNAGPFRLSDAYGIEPHLSSFPQLPLFFRLTLMLKEAEALGLKIFDIANIDPENLSQTGFYALDIYSTLSTSSFRKLVDELAYISKVDFDTATPGGDFDQLCAQLEILKANTEYANEIKWLAVLLTHYHADHAAEGDKVSSRIPQVIAHDANPFAVWLYKQKGDHVTVRNQPQTLLQPESDRLYTPPLHSLRPYETIFLHGGRVSITSLPCDHSIYGSTMYLIVVYDDLGLPLQKILYTGDYRFSDTGVTEHTVDLLYKIGVDVVITDTTNIRPPKSYSPQEVKTNKKVTRSRLEERYEELMHTYRDTPMVFQLDAKDMELLEIISRHAIAAGKLCYSTLNHGILMDQFLKLDMNDRHSSRNVEHQIATAKALHLNLDPEDPFLNEGFVTRNYQPRPRLNQVHGIYVSRKGTFTSLEKSLIYSPNHPVIHHQNLLQSDDWALFISPNILLQDFFGTLAQHLPKSTSIIRAHYAPYTRDDRKKVFRDFEFATQLGWDFISDLNIQTHGKLYSISASKNPSLRMSGHAFSEDFFNFMGGLIAANPGLKVVPVHGQERKYVSEEIIRRFRPTHPDLHVVQRIAKGYKGWEFEVAMY